MSEQLILQALQTAVITTITTAPINTAMRTVPIRPVGITGPRPSETVDGRWFEFVQIRNNRQGDYWSNEKVYQGNFRVILHWSVDESGVYTPTQWLDEIAAAFPKERILRNGSAAVQIYNSPDLSGVIEGAGDLLFPLALPYRSFRS